MHPTKEGEYNEDLMAAELREAFGLGPDATGFEADLSSSRASASSATFADWASRTPARLGQRLGDFEILDELGRGGMGIVYRARQLSLRRDVALKVLPTLTNQGAMAIQRFRNEARAAARMQHTHIVPIYAQGESEGHYYYAMELIEGGSLDDAIKTRSRLLSPSNPALAVSPSSPRSGSAVGGSRRGEHSAPTVAVADTSPPEAALQAAPTAASTLDARGLHRHRRDYRHLAALLADVADGLQHAHESGVIHRDIKPQNLLVGRDGRLHITDFGLARLAGAPTMTQTGQIMGTPAYLSPEQVTAKPDEIDHRTDIYSLGATLYELLTLRRPFRGQTRDQILTGIRTVEPVAPRRLDPAVPRELQTICQKAMAKDTRHRYASAAALAEDLRRFAEGRPILSRPTPLLVRGAKWARRHPARTLAIGACALALVLAGGLALSAAAHRRSQAADIVEHWQNQLYYKDYHAVDGALAALAEARQLGGDPAQIGKLEALVTVFADLGDPSREAALVILDAVLRDEPDDAVAMYLSAYVLDRLKQDAAAQVMLARADAYETVEPEGWFFRGLALHFDDPDEAIRSYERARSLRAAEGEFYMQATLHLARAHNQRMYTFRDINNFSAAEQALRAVIDYDVYGDYPHYLLATAHIFAAEFYTNNEAVRDGKKAADHHAAALAAARRGQAIAPDSPSCYQVEAYALEQAADLEGAAAAHSAALTRAAERHDRAAESLLYRWRLAYWLDDVEAALNDITAFAAFEADEPWIWEQFYPALLLAERGERDAALALARSMTDANPTSAIRRIWCASALRLIGATEEADAMLDVNSTQLDYQNDAQSFQSDAWVKALYEMVSGARPRASLDRLIESTEQPWRLQGEAEYHAAVRDLARGDRESARIGLQRAYRSFDAMDRYTYHGKLLLEKLTQDEVWPAWIEQ